MGSAISELEDPFIVANLLRKSSNGAPPPVPMSTLRALCDLGVPGTGDFPGYPSADMRRLPCWDLEPSERCRRKIVCGTMPSFCNSIPVTDFSCSGSDSMLVRLEKLRKISEKERTPIRSGLPRDGLS